MEPVVIAPTPKPTRGARVLRSILYGIMCLAVIMGLVFLFWSVQSSNVLEVKNSPFPVRPPVVSNSDAIFVRISYCKHSSAKGAVVARLIGKRSIIRLPWPEDTQAARCFDQEVPIPIPAYATDDVYYFQFDVTYQVNPIKTQTVTMRSQEFTVQSH